MKKFLIIMLLLSFVFSSASLSFAAGEFYWVTKIDNDMVIVRDSKGNEKIFAGATIGLNIGDKVTIKEGKIVKSEERTSGQKKRNIDQPR